MSRVAVLCLLLAACQPPAEAGGPAKDAAPTPKVHARMVEVLDLKPAPFAEVVELSATLHAPRDVRLAAQAAGTVEMLLEVGQTVKAGALVARLDPGLSRAARAQAEAQTNAAKASLALAKETLRRQSALHKRKIISDLELANLKARVAQAEAQVQQAKALRSQADEQIKLTRVVAPFEGRVEETMVERGAQVGPGTPIARLLDAKTVKVRAGVPERYAADIVPGAALTVVLGAYGLPDVEGQATFVGHTIDPRNRSFPVEVSLPNEASRLKPGMAARIRLTRAKVANALVIPRSAIGHDGESAGVFVAIEKAGTLRAERRSVKEGARQAGQVVITEGLAPGDRVIVKGQSELSTGDPVRVQQLDAQTGGGAQ